MRMARAVSTVIDATGHHQSKLFESTNMNCRVAATIVSIAFTSSVPAYAADYEVGIVIQGAFLLSEEPNVRREGKDVHGLVGYLPIGTPIYFKAEPRTINNLTKAHTETYFQIFSGLGINGLLRNDLFIPIRDNPIAVVVSTTDLHNPDPAKGETKKLLTIGRYDNAYLEIIGEDETHYHATLHRRDNLSGLPPSEPVRLWKEVVEQGLVIVIEPQTFDEQSLPVPKWSGPERLGDKTIKGIVEYVGDKFESEFASAEAILRDADAIQCLLKASADADLGFRFFNNGLSFHLDMAVKDHSQMLRLMQLGVQLTGEDHETVYLLLQNVKCDGWNPERLQRLTLQEGVYDPERRASVRLKDLAAQPSQWIISLQGREFPFRMIRIADEQGYMSVLAHLDGLATSGKSFISELTPKKKEILLNLILRNISYFEHRDQRVSN